ncbi:MAG: phosphopantetheine-binding protein [Planctomycetota bacterium]
MEDLPITGNGKVDRNALPPPADSVVEECSRYEPPATDLEHRLVALWSSLLKRERVGVTDPFFEIGGHSLLAAEMFSRMEREFNIRLPLASLFQHGTIRELARLIAEARLPRDLVSVVTLQAGKVGLPLYLLPSVGGELLFGRRLIQALGPDLTVLGLQPSLRPAEIDAYRDFRMTAAGFVRALRVHQPQGPYALLGYSYGGLMGYEITRQLGEMGENVDLLAILDTGPGNRGVTVGWRDAIPWTAGFLANLPLYLREEMGSFSARRLWDSVARRIRRAGRILRSKMHRETSKVLLDDVVNIDHVPTRNRELMMTIYAAFRDYMPPKYPCKVTLFRANTRPLLGKFSADLGWKRFVAEVEIHPIAGNHESILHSPRVEPLARLLREKLDERSVDGRSEM